MRLCRKELAVFLETVTRKETPYVELMNDGRHDIQNFRLTSIRHIAVVVHENRLEKGRDHAIVDHLQVIRFFDISVDKLQNFLLDCSQTADLGCLGGNIP